jgi:outer membrane protein assembly factor BamB
MSNPNDLHATTCPSCGAPITMGPVSGTCTFCGTVVERRGARFPSGPARRAPQAAPAPRGCALAIAALVSLLLIGAGLGFVLWRTPPVSRPPITVSTAVAVVVAQTAVSESGQPPAESQLGNIGTLSAIVSKDAPFDDLLVYLRNNDKLELALIDGASRQLRWRAPALSDKADRGQMLVSESAVFATDQEQLRALSLRDGSVLWQTSLVAEPVSPCEGCFALLGGKLLVLQKDGSLQAFDPQGGQLVWSKRLPNQPRRLPAVDGLLGVVVPGQGREAGRIELLDPASGEVQRKLEPRCAADPSGRVNVWTQILLGPDPKSFYVLLGPPARCLQRWDSGASKPAWETELEIDTVAVSVGAKDYLVTAGHLFLLGSDNKTVTVIDTATGKRRTLLDDQDYDKLPVLASDSMLVLKTAPKWDSGKQALWGVDIASGERRWQFAADGGDFRPERLFGDWSAYLTPKGLLVLQAPREGKQLTADLLDLNTGVSGGRQTTELERSGSPVWQELRSERLIWWDIGSTVYAIDPATGQVLYTLT